MTTTKEVHVQTLPHCTPDLQHHLLVRRLRRWWGQNHPPNVLYFSFPRIFEDCSLPKILPVFSSFLSLKEGFSIFEEEISCQQQKESKSTIIISPTNERHLAFNHNYIIKKYVNKENKRRVLRGNATKISYGNDEDYHRTRFILACYDGNVEANRWIHQ